MTRYNSRNPGRPQLDTPHTAAFNFPKRAVRCQKEEFIAVLYSAD